MIKVSAIGTPFVHLQTVECWAGEVLCGAKRKQHSLWRKVENRPEWPICKDCQKLNAEQGC